MRLEGHSGELRWRTRRGHITMDSGAAESVMPPEDAPDIPVQEQREHKKGINCVVANGSQVPNLGKKKIRFNTKDGTNSGITLHITNARKPLPSVTKIVQKGNSVPFFPGGSFYPQRPYWQEDRRRKGKRHVPHRRRARAGNQWQC